MDLYLICLFSPSLSSTPKFWGMKQQYQCLQLDYNTIPRGVGSFIFLANLQVIVFYSIN